MITIDGLTLDTEVRDIIEYLAKTLFEERGMVRFATIKDTEDNLMVTCPFHKNGQESKPSCGIRKDTGVVHCFTCGTSMTLAEMIGFCFDRDYLFGIEWLRRNFQEIIYENRDSIYLDYRRDRIPQERQKFVSEEELDRYRYTHPYMYKRKLTDEVINLFDVGYDGSTQCLTFPVRDINGNCLFVARRSVNTKYFNYPSGVTKPLYGLYELQIAGSGYGTIVICESIINCLTCWTHGLRAIALNGTGSSEQIKEISLLPYRSFVLALDPDSAGNKGIHRIKDNCKNKIFYTVDYNDSRDINDLSYSEVDKLFLTKHLV